MKCEVNKDNVSEHEIIMGNNDCPCKLRQGYFQRQ